LLWQRKQGKAEPTITGRGRELKKLARLGILYDSEAVKLYLADSPIQNTTKMKVVDTYTTFLDFRGLDWIAPRYQKTAKMYFIPTEQELDLLIMGCGKTTSTVLQTLKETGIRIGELTMLKWSDINLEYKILSITPEKGSNPRIIKISEKLLGLINKLSHQHEPYIFQPSKSMQREYLRIQRRKVAERLGNPRIKQISFHTFRHWKGTLEYHKTKDIMHVRAILGHKSINSTLVYINIEEALYNNNIDEWICKVAHNEQEAIKLIETGFSFVNNMGDNCALYKKRK
jgi:integrase